MCTDCGCSTATRKASVFSAPNISTSPLSRFTTISVEKEAEPDSAPGHRIPIEERILAKNDEMARRNREWFSENGIRVVNLISSPGAGKTYLLEKTSERLAGKRIAILTGDQEKNFDERRLAARGARVKQINTLSSCHLDASMIAREIGGFVTPDLDLLIIENVGNLVCPAAFDLGESEKIALLSTTEGEDKPSKYPLLFHRASLVVITKTDLIPYLEWSAAECEGHVRRVNPSVPIIRLSARTGEGLDAWLDFLTPSITTSTSTSTRPLGITLEPLGSL